MQQRYVAFLLLIHMLIVPHTHPLLNATPPYCRQSTGNNHHFDDLLISSQLLESSPIYIVPWDIVLNIVPVLTALNSYSPIYCTQD